MNRFKMTSDGFHFWLPLLLTPLLLLPVFGTWVAARQLHHPVLYVAFGTTLGVVGLLVVTTLLTPVAVRLTATELELERLCWPSFRVPLSRLTQVEQGPVARVFSGEVGRVAGVGGWFWSGGLFRARGVGLVRAWLRRLGPTVVVRRTSGLPLLFGVDDPAGLCAALEARVRLHRF